MSMDRNRTSSKRLLIGTFYQPPKSDNTALNNIENAIDLARDTDIPEIIILVDFNLYMNTTALVVRLIIFVDNTICTKL